jgi:hypothetical protein
MRVGVLLDGVRAPAWAAWVLGAIQAHDDLELATVVISERNGDRRPSVLFAAYEALDRRVFGHPPDALEPVDVSSALEGVPCVHLPASPAQGEQHNGSGRAPALDEPSLDVLVCLGTAPSPGDIPVRARHGVWSLHLGDPLRYRSEPALFWELSFAEPASTSVLEAVVEGPEQHRVLYQSSTATDPISLQRTRNPVYWKSARFVLRRLEDLAAGRWSPELEPAGQRSTCPPTPSNADAVRHVARLAGRVTSRRLRRAAFRRQWFLGLRRRKADALPHEDPTPWQVVSPPADRYWADPFVFHSDGATHVFFEQVRYADAKGELAVARLERGAGLSAPEPILRAAHHLSYPYVFRDGADTFMVPESAEAQRVELWAATDFPTGWARVGALLEGVEAVDASILYHGGLYWMWVNHAVDGGRLDDETFLYFSDRLETGWTPHPRNPVVSDARRARPAGRPFLHGDVVIRPAQDCTGRYGSRVVFNAVEVMTPDDYRERPVGSLGPSWAGGRNLCAHTYTFDGSVEATDGLRLISRLRRRRGVAAA